MERQLVLLEPDDAPDTDWQLDEETKELGRRGVAAARAALQEARRRAMIDDRHHHAA